MSQHTSRREFLTGIGVAGVTGALACAASNQSAPALQQGRIRKSLKLEMVKSEGSLLDRFKLLKEVGFDGVEISAPNKLDAAEVVAARDASGLIVDGVVDSVQWKDTLSDPDPAVRGRGVAGLEAALRAAKAYGADSVLLVPGRVDKQTSYADVYTRSQAEIRKVIPLAAELDVIIAVEDVWNGFLLSPLEMARYIDELASSSVRVHFDVGNVVRFGWPEQWIRILGKRIFKLDIKEYSRKKEGEQGPWKGFDVEIGDGDCDWPAVMKALHDIGFAGWGCAEVPGGGRERLADIARRMDRVFAM